jgi:hypothetical protein
MPIIRVSKPVYDLIYEEAYARRQKLIDFVDHVFLDVYKREEDGVDNRRGAPVKRRTIRRPVVSA